MERNTKEPKELCLAITDRLRSGSPRVEIIKTKYNALLDEGEAVVLVQNMSDHSIKPYRTHKVLFTKDNISIGLSRGGMSLEDAIEDFESRKV